jgi:hypothetical protein
MSAVIPAVPVISSAGMAAAPTLFAPILDTLAAVRARHGDGPVRGLIPGLIAPRTGGFWPAKDLTAPPGLDELLAAAADRWKASQHAAAALAWKSYAYWVLVPAVYGYAAARRIPRMDATNVFVYIDHSSAPLLTVGVREAAVTVLPSDPLSALAGANVRVVADEAALLAEFRRTVLDAHLAPMLASLAGRVHLGRRTLLGSVASGIGHALTRASDVLPGSAATTAETLLRALSVEHLVEMVAGGVQRKTCCLAFTLPEPKICRGCCIR